MSDKETVYSSDLEGYEPCTECLDVALDAAYSNGFTTENDEYQLVDESFDDAVYNDILPRSHTEESY